MCAQSLVNAMNRKMIGILATSVAVGALCIVTDVPAIARGGGGGGFHAALGGFHGGGFHGGGFHGLAAHGGAAHVGHGLSARSFSGHAAHTHGVTSQAMTSHVNGSHYAGHNLNRSHVTGNAGRLANHGVTNTVTTRSPTIS